MTIRNSLLAAGSALLLSAGSAAAAPAVTESAVNMRAGPGTQYGVVTTLPAGATVDVAGCTGSWCQVDYGGRQGYVSANYLDMDGGPGPVAVAPQVYYDDEPVYGYDYGPSIGIYTGRPGWYGRPGWQGRRGGWAGRPGWNGRPGGWAGRPGGNNGWAGRSGGQGRIGTGNFNRGAGNIGPRMGNSAGPRMGNGGGPRMSAPAGLSGGGRGAVGLGGAAVRGGGAPPQGR